MRTRNILASVAIATAVVLTGVDTRTQPAEASTAQSIIMRAGGAAAKVRKIHNVPSLGVINLRHSASSISGFGGRRDGKMFYRGQSEFDSVPFLKLYAERNQSGIAALRRALKANPATRSALAARGVNINRVVGADVGTNGSLRLYIL